MTTDRPTQLGMVGLGRMGANLVRRLMRDGHECVVRDRNAETVKLLESEGAIGTTSLEDFVARLSSPRNVWVMLPAGEITESTVVSLAPGSPETPVETSTSKGRARHTWRTC